MQIWEHRLVLWDKIGPGYHPCHWCGLTLAWFPDEGEVQLFTDHIDRDKQNNDPTNLVPTCCRCNTGRGRFVTDDELFIVRANGKRLRASAMECEWCHESFLVAHGARAAGRRTCDRSCAGKLRNSIRYA